MARNFAAKICLFNILFFLSFNLRASKNELKNIDWELRCIYAFNDDNLEMVKYVIEEANNVVKKENIGNPLGLVLIETLFRRSVELKNSAMARFIYGEYKGEFAYREMTSSLLADVAKTGNAKLLKNLLQKSKKYIDEIAFGEILNAGVEKGKLAVVKYITQNWGHKLSIDELEYAPVYKLQYTKKIEVVKCINELVREKKLSPTK